MENRFENILNRSANVAKGVVNFVGNIDYNPVHWYQGVKKIFRETPAEILVLMATGAIVAGGLSYSHENKKSHQIPLGFSEIGQIERDADVKGRDVPPFTHYLTTANDATMKIFECWNHSHTLFNSKNIFASELDYRMDPSLKIYRYNLADLLEELPVRARVARNSFKDFICAGNKVNQANNDFDDAWSESHVDHYRTEIYTETEYYTDHNGKQRSRMVTKTREVYDHTTHSYHYDEDSGEMASRKLDNVLKRFPDLFLKEKLQVTSKTQADGEYAAELSRKNKSEKDNFDDKDFLNFANMWAEGSTLSANLPEIYSSWNRLHGGARDWRNAKSTAHSTTYNTCSRFDSGPREFRIAEDVLDDGRVFVSAVEEIADSVNYTEANASKLGDKINEFVGVEMDSQEGNSSKLQNEIMKLTRQIYDKNFKKGFDVHQFSPLFITLMTLSGGLLGGLAGFGVDRLGDKYKIWR